MAEGWDGFTYSPASSSLPLKYKVRNRSTGYEVDNLTLVEVGLQFMDVLDLFEVSKMPSWTYKDYGNYRIEARPLKD